MKILSSSEFFYIFHGGWEISQFTVLRHLAKSHDVHAVFWGPNDANFELKGIKLHQRNLPFKQQLKTKFPRTFPDFQVLYENLIWGKLLEQEIRKVRPDLILTELRYAPATVEKSSIHGIPCIFFIRSYEHFCPVEFIHGLDRCASLCRGRCWNFVPFNEKRLLPPFTKKMLEKHRRAFRDASLVLANSCFVKNVVKIFCRVESEVVYPFIDLHEYKVEKREPRYILFVRPAPYKGGNIVFEIAKALPEYQFLVCGGGSVKVIKKLQALKNVKCMSWIEDMKEAYSRTYLMLIPSVWPEPFGRVAVEAMANGIPCIASKRGGLPEAIGDAGILVNDIFDIENWINSIQKLEGKQEYGELSQKARSQAQKFDLKRVFEGFRELIVNSIGIHL